MEEFTRSGEINGVSNRKYDFIIKLLDDITERDEVAMREDGANSKCAFYKEKGIRFGLGHKDDRMFYWAFGKDQDSVNGLVEDIVTLLNRRSKNYKIN